MWFRNVGNHLALAVCFLSAAVPIVRAGTIMGGTASLNEALPFSTTLSGFSQYDGVVPLAAIEFLFVTDLTGTASVTSGPGNPTQTVTLDFSSALSVSDPTDTTILVTAFPTASSSITLPGDGTLNTFQASGTNLKASAVLTNPAQFAPFEGTGTYNLPVSGVVQVGFTPDLTPPFSVPSAIGSVSGTLDVLYITVSEPSTAGAVWLGGLALAAVWSLRRRTGSRAPIR